MGGINKQHHLFDQVFEQLPKNLNLPVVSNTILFDERTFSSKERIMWFKDERSFINSYTYGKGKVYLIAGSLDKRSNNLVSNALFPPLIFNMGLYASSSSWQAKIIGQDHYVEVPVQKGVEELYKIKGKGTEFIPEHKPLQNKLLLGVHDQINQAGLYSYNNDRERGWVGFNFDRTESDLTFFSVEELQQIAEEKGYSLIEAGSSNDPSVVADAIQGKQLWRYAILLALLFLAIEILLLRIL